MRWKLKRSFLDVGLGEVGGVERQLLVRIHGYEHVADVRVDVIALEALLQVGDEGVLAEGLQQHGIPGAHLLLKHRAAPRRSAAAAAAASNPAETRYPAAAHIAPTAHTN